MSRRHHQKPKHPRSPHWPAARRRHLQAQRGCAVCGSTERLEVHHVRPYHLFPELELDPRNLITLCEAAGRNCHHLFGHLLDWHSYNRHVRRDARAWRQRIERRPAGAWKRKAA